ncbi:MAG: M23 family metallopeptidase [Rickettsiales bacterium]|jgi:murein DD-endopeptidase MepM/ murein hydrolase activator NlpD|nr:M23 family metallopeptidase [Rickettsiales bacterium]
MSKIALKKNPFARTFFERVRAAFSAVFKDRAFLVPKNGRFVSVRFSGALVAVATLLFILLLAWTAHVSRIYFSTAHILETKDKQVLVAKEKFNATVADIRAYRDTIEAINEKMEKQHAQIAEMLLETGKISKKDREKIAKERRLLSAELKFVGENLSEYAKNANWATSSSAGYGSTKAELEKNIVLNENVFLKKRNSLLETSIDDMAELQANIIDKVVILADGKLGEIEKTLSKVDIILSQVNLKDRRNLVEKARGEKEEGLGGRFVPIKTIDLMDENLSRRFKDAAAKVNLWEGLSKATGMLPLGVPVKGDMRITSSFGVRDDPFFATPAMHTGIDFAGKTGTPLYSTSKGKVTQVGNRGDYGLAVEVYHGLGFSTLYAHLSKISVAKGDMVEEGTKVGLAGSTGRSTAAHLHYELRHNGRPLNPYAFIKAEAMQ